MKAATSSADPLDRIWNEVINIPPDDSWLTGFLNSANSNSHPVKGAAKAMKKLLGTNVSIEDLGRIGRAERYEASFGVLYALDDPGLEKGKLAGLHALLAKGKPSSKLKVGRETEFLKSLWDDITGDLKGEFLAEQAEEPGTDKPFGDTPPALKRLIDAGVDVPTLGCVQTWHRFEARFHTLRILAECFSEAEETIGLHESILGADPSGLEGRPGSWPTKKSAESPRSKPALKDPTEPKFVIKFVQNFDFTPDSKFVVGCGSGPICVYGIADGKELVTMAKAKNACAFWVSPDSKSLVASLDNAVSISDLATGAEVVRKRWQFTGRVEWTTAGIFLMTKDGAHLLDPAQLNPVADPVLQKLVAGTKSIRPSPNGKLLGVTNSNPEMLVVLRMPEAIQIAGWANNWSTTGDAWAWSSDGRYIVAGEDAKHVFDVNTGQRVFSLGCNFGPFALSPDNKWLVTGTHSKGVVTIWNFADRSKVREFTIKAGWCFSLQISNDGKLLGAATHRQSLFWDFQRLVGS